MILGLAALDDGREVCTRHRVSALLAALDRNRGVGLMNIGGYGDGLLDLAKVIEVRPYFVPVSREMRQEVGLA